MPEPDAKLQVKPRQRLTITGLGPDLAIAPPRASATAGDVIAHLRQEPGRA